MPRHPPAPDRHAPPAAAGPPPFDPQAFVAGLSTRPGVYRMLDAAGTVLYVGKARNLKARVASYFRADQLQPKVQVLVQQIVAIEVTVTGSDTEALLLEFNLIKKLKPRYNIMLRDDKSFPFLYLTTHQKFPRLSFYRGSRQRPGRFFGPYPSSLAVRETLLQLQKLFRLRSCEDSYFEHRSRPCLQYQIRRCSAPCVGLVSDADYAADVAAAVRVLEGRNHEVAQELTARMETAAVALDFEKAAKLRDQLAALKNVQAQQFVTAGEGLECDVLDSKERLIARSSSTCMTLRGDQAAGRTIGG